MTTIGQPSPTLQVGILSNVPVTVTNQGSATATGPIQTTITLPAGVSAPATFTSNGWSCTTTGNTVTCTNPGSIGVGSSSRFFVPVTPAASTVGTTPGPFVATTAPVAGETNNANNTSDPMTPTNAVLAEADNPDDNPKPVTLVRFSALWSTAGVNVKWATSNEISVFGFRLYRSATADRSDAQMVGPEIIISQGLDGGDYTFFDRSAKPGTTYTYWLVSVTPANTPSDIASDVAIGASGKLYLPLIRR